jgi:N-acetylmuramoyl-L-alanine amidase
MSNYKIYVLSFLIIGILTINLINAQTDTQPLKDKIVYLDPGHGGRDPGAISKDIAEEHINLAISLKLRDKLEALGATVYLTRYGDYDLAVPYARDRKRSDLSRRVSVINKSNCDLYLSIHLNADPSSTWRGGQVFYDDINDENIKVAKIMQQELKTYLGTRRKVSQMTDMYIHRRVDRPGVLIEVGFLSNPGERYVLTKNYYQEKVAKVITGGVVKYFSSK